MIVLVLAAAAAAAQPQASSCPDLVTPEALVCHAIHAQAQGDSAAAAQSFEQAAIASPDKDPGIARLYAAAGNMWIAANQPGKAAFALDRALQSPGLEGAHRGEVLLDRARAAEAQNDLKTARATVTQATSLIEADPFLWYFSAALSVREGNPKAAESAINRALRIAPTDPTLLFEAGHIAQLNGDNVGARDYFNRAIEGDPEGPSGRAAREALAMMPVPLTIKK